jgi:hypothetical protein
MNKLGNAMERLRSKSKDLKRDPSQPVEHFIFRIPFCKEQLFWLEEKPECWIEVLALPEGFDFDLEQPIQLIQIKQIPDFLHENKCMNIWRSWNMWRDQDQKDYLGQIPFWIDIDNKDEDLLSSLLVTRVCIEFLLEHPAWAGETDRIRIGFSGRKGFHIYGKPFTDIDATEIRTNLIHRVHERLCPECQNHDWNVFKNNTEIDLLSHDSIRIMGSNHSWIDDDGNLRTRRTREISCKFFMETEKNTLLQYLTEE